MYFYNSLISRGAYFLVPLEGRVKLHKMHFRSQGQSIKSEGSETTANILIKRLDEKHQERWIETVESIDFTHTSRRA